MTVFNRADALPFQTADGSQIREFLNPGNCELRHQSLAEATLLPGQQTTLHFHPRAEEIYYFLRGSGTLEIDGERRAVGAGDAVAIPNGARHQICNEGAVELVFLCCCAPPYSHEDTVLCEEKAR